MADPGEGDPRHFAESVLPNRPSDDQKSPGTAGYRSGNQHLSAEASSQLVERARGGDQAALNALYARYLPALMRWASGRLPRWTRDMSDTVDLVQDTLLHSIKHLPAFEYRGEGALLAYLRQGVVNRIKDELRKTARRSLPGRLNLDVQHVLNNTPSPLEEAMGREALERYESALKQLQPEEREAIIARLELDQSYLEIAQLLHKPSPDAARMVVARALVKLAEEMGRAER